MVRRLVDNDKLFVAQSPNKQIGHFRAGASLEKRTGYTIDEIVAKSTTDRVQFAGVLLKASQKALRLRPPEYRIAISRGYYAMYHAFRAVVFFAMDGDDHQKHSQLPDHIPTDFPNHASWQNRLKVARLERNRADYEPYPVFEKQFESVAGAIVGEASQLLPIIRSYLKGKGCRS